MAHLAFIPAGALPLARPSPFARPAAAERRAVLPAQPAATRRRARVAPSACAPSPTTTTTTTTTVTAPPDAATTTTPPAAPAFGRGAMMSRRVVGLWELQRAKLDPAKLVAPDDKVETRVTVGIALFILGLFVVPVTTGVRLPEFAIAGASGTLLALWAVDTLALGSRVASAAGAALSDRRRVARHEAGHFLVGYLLGFRPDSYDVPGPRARLVDGATPGVDFRAGWAGGDAHRVAAVGMAGVVAEGLVYGRCDGGLEDIADVGRRVRECVGGRITQDKRTAIVRWGMVVAAHLIDRHQAAYDALVDDMMAGRSVEECVRRVDGLVDQEALEDKPFDHS